MESLPSNQEILVVIEDNQEFYSRVPDNSYVARLLLTSLVQELPRAAKTEKILVQKGTPSIPWCISLGEICLELESIGAREISAYIGAYHGDYLDLDYGFRIAFVQDDAKSKLIARYFVATNLEEGVSIHSITVELGGTSRHPLKQMLIELKKIINDKKNLRTIKQRIKLWADKYV